jgi:hypothetical protein
VRPNIETGISGKAMFATAKIAASGMLYLAMAAGTISAQGLPPRIEAASARLAKAHIFAIGGVGFAGMTSDEEKDFRLILADSSASKVFVTLYERGNNQAKAYALLGLYTVDPDRFHEIFPSATASNEELHQMQGCIMSNEKLSILAKRIGDGAFSPRK